MARPPEVEPKWKQTHQRQRPDLARNPTESPGGYRERPGPGREEQNCRNAQQVDVSSRQTQPSMQQQIVQGRVLVHAHAA